ncbi:MAG: hypothetical protein KAS32_08090 [Candidatus Peribacteraceae bacterium]|nr:hypothetical protein [Candidatus Peribacteraceae bacterium]
MKMLEDCHKINDDFTCILHVETDEDFEEKHIIPHIRFYYYSEVGQTIDDDMIICNEILDSVRIREREFVIHVKIIDDLKCMNKKDVKPEHFRKS